MRQFNKQHHIQKDRSLPEFTHRTVVKLVVNIALHEKDLKTKQTNEKNITQTNKLPRIHFAATTTAKSDRSLNLIR